MLVHGALSDHTSYAALVRELRDRVTTFTMDRRGRGASGDGADYAIGREFEDVAAVVNTVAARTGSPVSLWGHSYGANCVMGGAAVTDNADRLVLYEPGLGTAYPAGSLESAEEAVAAGDAEGGVLAVLVGVLEMTKEEVDTMRSSSLWPTRLAIVPTMPRELRAEDDWVYVPGQFDAITAPTLVLAGSESPPVQDDATRKAAAAIPGAQIRVLEGHGHFAIQTAPAMLAAIIRQWISS